MDEDSTFSCDKNAVVKAFLKDINKFDEVVVIGKRKNKPTYLASSCSTERTEDIMDKAWGEWIMNDDG